MLPRINGRPLTLIRFPDGIGEDQFYQKDKPDWAPEWVESEVLGDEGEKDYILPTETAILVWLANLASIEFHQMNVRRPDFSKPDYMVFDLDPADNSQLLEFTILILAVYKYGLFSFITKLPQYNSERFRCNCNTALSNQWSYS